MPSIQPDAPVNPDPLGRLTDQLAADLAALLPPEKQHLAERLARTLSDWTAELIGRAAAQSASVGVATLHRVEDIERRERARTQRVEEFQRTINGQVDTIWSEIEQLKARQAGDDCR